MSIPSDFQTSFEASGLPGAAIALVTGGEVQLASFGVKDIDANDPVTEHTIFDAASLSKPLVAYAVLQLVDAGVLNLDELLSTYAPHGLADVIQAAPITARHVLSHTSGLPHAFGSEPLRLHFEPGSRYSYSSVGFLYLQRAVEVLTGEPLEATMRRLVFEPLAMHSSSMIWQDRFVSDFAFPHIDGKRLPKPYPPVASASYTLQTTAKDYAAFLATLLDSTRVTEAAVQQGFVPVRQVPKRLAVNLGYEVREIEENIAWGLGWGIELPGRCFFQWGKLDGVRAFAMGCREQRRAVVLLSNGNTGLRMMEALARSVLAGPHSAIDWLEVHVTE